MKCLAIAAFGLAGCVLLGSARADDLTRADRFICSSGSVAVCCEGGECATGTPDELNIPQFIEVDMVQKRVNTTKASGLNRTSPIDNLKRVDGKIVLQGVENQLAYSFLIDEKTGSMSVAVARDGCSVTAFGSCTPLPAAK